MVLPERATSMVFVCVVCIACGGRASQHDPESGPGGTSGAAGALPVGELGSSGSSNSPGSSSSGTGTGGSAGTEVSTGPGTVTDLWSAFCVATISADFPAKDSFQVPLFTARSGEKYLILRSNDGLATLAYLTPTGPIEFDVSAGPTLTFPFTSSCAPKPPNSYFAVFADVTIFAEPSLITKLCDLKAGAKVVREVVKSAGYQLNTLGPNGSVYEIYLNAFSPQCGRAESGYISVPEITILGAQRFVVPFQVVDAE